jgi:hypothetical protein
MFSPLQLVNDDKKHLDGEISFLLAQIVLFILHMYSDYTRLIRACLTHSPVSGIQDLLDHRYFYVDTNSCGRSTCGLARQAIIEFLREHAEGQVFLLLNGTNISSISRTTGP